MNPKKATLAFLPIYRKNKNNQKREANYYYQTVGDGWYNFLHIHVLNLNILGHHTVFQILKFHLILWHEKQAFSSFPGPFDLTILRPICLWSWRWGGWVRVGESVRLCGICRRNYVLLLEEYGDPFSLIYKAWPISVTIYGPCQCSLPFLSCFFSSFFYLGFFFLKCS